MLSGTGGRKQDTKRVKREGWDVGSVWLLCVVCTRDLKGEEKSKVAVLGK